MEEETNQTKHSEMLMDFQAPLYLGPPGPPKQKKSICSHKKEKSQSITKHPLGFQEI